MRVSHRRMATNGESAPVESAAAVLATVARLVAETTNLTDIVSRLAPAVHAAIPFDELHVLRLDRAESFTSYISDAAGQVDVSGHRIGSADTPRADHAPAATTHPVSTAALPAATTPGGNESQTNSPVPTGSAPHPARPAQRHASSPNERDGDMHCLVIPSGPADKQETCSLFFVEAITAARERVWITTPYLVPDEAVFAALRLAALRGVDVRILLPSRRDHIVVFEASRLYAYDSIRAGVRVFRYRPGFLHQKVVLIDDVAAAVGSANLDNRSFRLNFEIMVLTISRTFAAEVEQMLLEDFGEAYEIDRSEYRTSPAWRRMAMHVARLFAPIL